MTRRHFLAILSVIPLLFTACTTIQVEPGQSSVPLHKQVAEVLKDADADLYAYSVAVPASRDRIHEIRKHLSVAIAAYDLGSTDSRGKLEVVFAVADAAVADIEDDSARGGAAVILHRIKRKLGDRFGFKVGGEA